MASPHEVLGVDPDADAETVQRRYRELVKEVHPDAGGSAQEFKRVRKAYRAIVEGDAYDGTGPGAAGGSGRTDQDTGESTEQTEPRSENEQYTAGRRRSRNEQYTASGRGSKASAGRDGGSARAGGAGATAGETDQRRSRRDSAQKRGKSSTTRRAFLYVVPSVLGLGVVAHYQGVFEDLFGQESVERSSTREGTVSKEVSPDDLFPVTFQASAGSTIRFSVDGADTSDWVRVYTETEYERVASDWEETGEFDPGDPLRTVLTEDGYVCDLPDEGTYVILVKLWSGPPDDPREARTVEVDYEISP